MDKRKLDSGFTLVEIILVLFIVSLLLLMFPMIQVKRNSVLKMQVEALRYQFINAQSEALYKKVNVAIACEGSFCSIDDTVIELANEMRCHGNVSFNKNGNASRATTFKCSIASQQRDLIVQLGSGRMYVR